MLSFELPARHADLRGFGKWSRRSDTGSRECHDGVWEVVEQETRWQSVAGIIKVSSSAEPAEHGNVRIILHNYFLFCLRGEVMGLPLPMPP